MRINAVAFVPSAPLLVPAVAGGSAALDDDLRSAAVDVTRRLHESDEIIVAAPTDHAGEWGSEATWSFAGFGVPRRPSPAGAVLPWSLGIGAWLLEASGWSGPRRYLGIGAEPWSTPAATAGNVGLLVVGDGSSRRTEKAPGHLDDRAAGFDASIARALAGGDPVALGRIDPELATDLMCAGAPVWRWLAAALGDDRPTTADLLVDDARYGVGYFVAGWRFG